MKTWLRNLLIKFKISGELVEFLWKNKLWWLIPLMVILIVFGLLLFIASATGLAPFIYTLI